MHIKATLLAIATASAVTAQPDFEDAFVNSAKYWSDYGDYLAKVLGDSVNVATAGKVLGFHCSWYPSMDANC